MIQSNLTKILGFFTFLLSIGISSAQSESANIGYKEGEVIVKFHSKYVNKSIVDNESVQEGKLFNFLNYEGILILTEKLEHIGDIENWHCSKIFSNLKTTDSISISRQGKPIRVPTFWSVFVVKCPASFQTIKIINQLNNIGSPVLYAQANFTDLELYDIPDDSEYENQHSLNPISYPNAGINIEQAWGIETGKSFVKVGVYDSGIDSTHEDLNVLDGQGLYTDINSWGYGTSGHGTSVAGIIGAKRNNGVGIAGIAGGDGSDSTGVSLIDFKRTVDVVPSSDVRIIARGIVDGARKVGNYYQWEGLYQTGDHPTFNLGGYGIHIGNYSWGIRTKVLQKNSDSLFQKPIEKSNDPPVDEIEEDPQAADCPLCKEAMLFAYQSGVVNVVSAGNSKIVDDNYIDPSRFPQNMPYNWILKVGASARDGQILTTLNNAPSEGTYSSYFGDGMDIIAPGTRDLVYTTRMVSENPDTIYHTFNGTSASAPHAAGVASLLLSYYNKPCYSKRNLSPDDVEYVLTRTAVDLSANGYDDSTGWGRLNAYEALKMVELPENQIIHVDSVVSSQIVSRDTILVRVNNAITDGEEQDSQGPIGDDFPESFQIFKDYLLERVKVEQVLDFSNYMQSNTDLIDYWANRSACKSLRLHNDTTSIGETINYDVFDVNPTIYIDTVINNQITVTGYVYYFIEGYNLGLLGQTLPIDYWYPSHPNNAYFEVSILIKDTLHPQEHDFPCYDTRPLTDTTMNIEETELKDFLNVYPNPNQGQFIIEFYSGETAVLEIKNELGQIVHAKNYKQSNSVLREEISIRDIANGLYYIRLQYKNGKTILKKIIKQ